MRLSVFVRQAIEVKVCLGVTIVASFVQAISAPERAQITNGDLINISTFLMFAFVKVASVTALVFLFAKALTKVENADATMHRRSQTWLASLIVGNVMLAASLLLLIRTANNPQFATLIPIANLETVAKWSMVAIVLLILRPLNSRVLKDVSTVLAYPLPPSEPIEDFRKRNSEFSKSMTLLLCIYALPIFALHYGLTRLILREVGATTIYALLDALTTAAIGLAGGMAVAVSFLNANRDIDPKQSRHGLST